jgi:hypothetical protein
MFYVDGYMVSHSEGIYNKLLGKTFRLMRDGVTQKLIIHKDKLHNFYSVPNNVRMIKSGRTKWAGQVLHA